MKKILKGILPGILLVTLATPGIAENRQGAFNLSPFVGGYVLDHDQHEVSRPIFGLRGGYNITENVGLEALFGYSLTQTKKDFGAREVDNYRFGGEVLYHFMPNEKLVPFVAAGFGATDFIEPDSPNNRNHYAALFSYGLGLKYFVADDVALRGDVRHAVLFDDIGDNNLEYSVGLTFQFGGEKKAVVAVAAAAASEAVADTTAPTVIFTTPVNGATAMPVNQKAYVAFSEEMDPATLTGESFTVKQGNTALSGRVKTAGANSIFIPANDLEKGMTYTATVTTGARDTAGNRLQRDYAWKFTTGMVADTTPPTVTFTSPVGGSTAAPVNQKINVAFSENMDPATLTADTLTVKQGKTAVAGKVTSAASTATFTPAKNLEKGKAYTATVTTGARDLAGNALAKDYAWNFTAHSVPKVVGVLGTLENSHFNFNSAEISENGKTILNHNITALNANPGMQIRISGHTSAAGTEDYNQKLSERRAESVKEYLVKTGGIDENRLTTIGFGEKYPAKHEDIPADKLSDAALANMRVIIEVIE